MVNASADPAFLVMRNFSKGSQYRYGAGRLSSRNLLRPGLSGLILIATALAFFHAAPLPAQSKSPSPAEKYNQPVREWYEGPVRYLLSRDEEKQYRELATDAERSRFIEDFWARRDAEPSTPANEFELRFWNRVAEADRQFRDAPYPGWKTDRGKIFILLGQPDEIRQGMSIARLGKEIPFAIWTYHEPRFEGMERDTQVRFLRDDSGEMRMTDRLFLSRLEMLSGAARSLAFQAGLAQKPPEPTQLLDTIAASKPPMDMGRFHTHYDFFLAADGSTSVVLTLGIRPGPPTPPRGGVTTQTALSEGNWKVYARLSDGASSFDLVDSDSFATSDLARDVDGFLLYQGRVSAPPGTYSVFYGIRNPATEELFSLSDRVQVPDFTRSGFSISSITLAARLGPAENPVGKAPFLVGRMTVVPKMDPAFQSGSDLAYYFQVYHPQIDPASGLASLDLTYQFLQAASLKKTGEPVFSPFGKPVVLENQTGQVHGYAVPLTGFPAGEFKIQVQVRDRVANRTVEAEARFSVR